MSHFAKAQFASFAALGLLLASISAFPAQAAINGTSLERWGPQFQSTAALSDLAANGEKMLLDWRKPSQTLKFDVPETDFIPSITLTLSADPLHKSGPSQSLFVQFNQDTPVEIKSTGRGFDAKITLNNGSLRTTNNLIRIFTEQQDAAYCGSEKDTGWIVDLASSKIAIQRQAKSRPFTIRDVESKLNNPLTAPELISIGAEGQNSTVLQSLIAQAIGQRMETTPAFTTLKNRGDFQIIAGQRGQIKQHVKNKSILQGKGARIILDKSRPMRLILTGDTDQEVLAMAKAFTEYALPDSVRQKTNIGELKMQAHYGSDARFISGKTKLGALGQTAFEPSWNPSDAVATFDVADPNASQGEIVLHLANSDNSVAPHNKVALTLNNYSLGQTTLRTKRQKVTFKVPAGVLKGQDNTLRFSADLSPQAGQECTGDALIAPNVYFKSKSYLKLETNGETPVTDLSRFTASGAPFSDQNGKETVIVLPRNNADFNAALGLLSQMAETHANGWVNANFVRGAAALTPKDKSKNILFLTPSNELPAIAKRAAPKTARTALKGNGFTGVNLLENTPERYASLNAQAAYQDASRKAARNNSIRRGGLASLYASPYDSGKMVGLITNVPGQSFTQSLSTLREDTHWNALEGSVARWNRKSVLMTELSSNLPGFARITAPAPAPKGAMSKWTMPELDSLTDRLPQVSLPEFSLPKIDGADIKQKLMFWKSDTPQTASPDLRDSFSPNSIADMSFENIRLSAPAPRPAQPNQKLALRPSNSADQPSFLDSVLPDSTVSIDSAKGFTAAVTAPLSSRMSEVNNRLEGKTPVPQKSAFDMMSGALPKLETQKQSFHFGPLQDKTAQALDWSAKTWTSTKQAVMNMKVRKDVNRLQKSVKPVGASWRKQLRGVSIPGQSAAKWSVQKLSAAALLLILMFGVVLFFLGASDAQSRTGQHH